MKFPLKSVIRLRGHHLICLHFFKGEGYNSQFLANLKNLLGRVKAGEEVEICSGADDVCKRCPYLRDGRCHYDSGAEDEIREMDRRALRLLRFYVHDKVKWQDIREKIPEILHEWSKDYCKDCEWRKVCRVSSL
jgi:hypothetical protein